MQKWNIRQNHYNVLTCYIFYEMKNQCILRLVHHLNKLNQQNLPT